MVLDLFYEKKWLRRLLLILMGLLLGNAYGFGLLSAELYESFAISFLVGLMSFSLLRGFYNSLIVLISVVAALLVYYFAVVLGAGIDVEAAAVLQRIAIYFEKSLILFVYWLPGVLLGGFVRGIVLKSQMQR